MTSRPFLLYFLRSMAVLLGLFTFFRIVFLCWNFASWNKTILEEFPAVFLGGLFIDLSTVSVIGGLCFLISRLFFFTGDPFRRRVFNFLFRLCFFASSIWLMADIFFFSQFGTRTTVLAMNITQDPGPILSTVFNSFPVIPVALIALIITVLYFLFSRNWSIQINSKERTQLSWMALTILVCVACSMFYLPEPLWTYTKQSGSTLVNQSTLNGFYSFFRSIEDHGLGEKDIPIYRFSTEESAVLKTSRLLGIESIQTNPVVSPFLRFSTPLNPGTTSPNIVIIILESFGANLTGALNKGQGYTPQFDKWSEKGMLFTDFYSNGPRTHQGVISTVSGFPAVLGSNLARRKGTKEFHTLAHILKSAGYNTKYLHNGDIQYDDLHLILKNSFDECSGKDDLEKISFETDWGACDEDLYASAVNKIFSADLVPTFTVLMTVSNHLPYDLPPAFVAAHPEIKKMTKMQSGMYYSDHALGTFLEECSKKEGFKNTYFFLLGDHAEMTKPSDSDLKIFHIPFLIIGPDITPGTNPRTGSQTDIAATIVDLLPVPVKHHAIGQTLLDTVTQAENGFAFCKGYLNDVFFKRGEIITRYNFQTGTMMHFLENPDRTLSEPISVSLEISSSRRTYIQNYMQCISAIFRKGRHRIN